MIEIRKHGVILPQDVSTPRELHEFLDATREDWTEAGFTYVKVKAQRELDSNTWAYVVEAEDDGGEARRLGSRKTTIDYDTPPAKVGIMETANRTSVKEA